MVVETGCLHQTSRTNVVEYIKYIYENGELKDETTCFLLPALGSWLIQTVPIVLNIIGIAEAPFGELQGKTNGAFLGGKG